MIHMGLTPQEALIAATSAGATALGLERARRHDRGRPAGRPARRRRRPARAAGAAARAREHLARHATRRRGRRDVARARPGPARRRYERSRRGSRRAAASAGAAARGERREAPRGPGAAPREHAPHPRPLPPLPPFPGGLLALIALTAGLSMIPPFLLRDLLDGVFAQSDKIDTTRLDLLVAGMVAIPIVTGIIGVWQTWLSNRIGQERHARPARLGLRASPAPLAGLLHAHAHGRGAVAHRQRHRRRAERGHLDRDLDRLERHDGDRHLVRDAVPQLAALAGGLRAPARVRPADAPRGCAATRDHARQAGLAGRPLDARRGVALGLGRAARQDDGAERRADRALPRRVGAPGRARAHASAWRAAGSCRRSRRRSPSCRRSSTASPAMRSASGLATISVGTLVAFTTLQTRLFFPVGSLLGVQADVQSSLALFDRIFEYLDLPGRHRGARGRRRRSRARTCAARCACERVVVRLRARAARARRTSASRPSRAPRSRSSARPAAARRRSAT